MSRFRPIHLGYAAAGAVLSATVLTVAPIVRANVAPPAAAPTSFVPITPCRLADTRTAPNGVGTRSTPLGESEVVPFTVRGQNGQCNIPTTATGIVANVTAVGPSAASFVTLYPADAAQRPLASNLNLVPGGAPTPNLVSVKLSATGVVNAFNRFGTVDLIIDIVGYNTPAGAAGTIASGTTVTGEAFWDAHVSGENNARDGLYVPLPGKAPVPLTDENLRFGPGISNSESDPTCDGTVDAPTAPPGKVCIYTNQSLTFVALPGPITAHTALLDDQGFRIWWRSTRPAGEDSVQWFTWAYTAP